MELNIDTIAFGAKTIGGLASGYAVKEFAEALAEIVFDNTPKEMFTNPTARKFTIKMLGLSAGVGMSACISKKVDDYANLAKVVEKVVKEVMESTNNEKEKGTNTENQTGNDNKENS